MRNDVLTFLTCDSKRYKIIARRESAAKLRYLKDHSALQTQRLKRSILGFRVSSVNSHALLSLNRDTKNWSNELCLERIDTVRRSFAPY